jgi:hypothetical protein
VKEIAKVLGVFLVLRLPVVLLAAFAFPHILAALSAHANEIGHIDLQELITVSAVVLGFTGIAEIRRRWPRDHQIYDEIREEYTEQDLEE